MDTLDGLPVLAFADRRALEEWLDAHHEDSPGVWLKLAKKASGVASVATDEVIDLELCFGWIDGQRRRLDETYFLQKITPRRPRGTWSKRNIDRAEALIAEGRVRARGLAEIAAAKADGRWDAAYDAQAEATVPDDLAAALDAEPRARRTYDGLGRTDRYLVILRLQTARTARTRAARLERMVATLAAGEKVR
ncbi:YdeI/OmpD-associated family protein [Streptomyces aureoverticillatus]|uniref:YdeI/OmpD-associated family protein n=1 Tax=Streptomyces aureoverticillatus TaxID=66871 RepID=UPI0013D9A329|nr:YdeI/OmpD-associated family protein [Streptomyces aureoverticillatus]QIB42793.1 OmdA domain containing protein [Streptomyces aureoverticillatus]